VGRGVVAAWMERCPSVRLVRPGRSRRVRQVVDCRLDRFHLATDVSERIGPSLEPILGELARRVVACVSDAGRHLEIVGERRSGTLSHDRGSVRKH